MILDNLFNNKRTLSESRYGRDSWDSNMPGYQGDYGGASNWGRREREDDEHHELDRQREQQLAQYAQSGDFWLKRKDTQEIISDVIVGKAAANAAALELLKQQPELKGNLLITANNPSQGVAEGAEQRWRVTVGNKSGTLSHTKTFTGTKEQAIKQAVTRFATSKNPVVTAELVKQDVKEGSKEKTTGVALSKAYQKDFDGKTPGHTKPETALTGTYSKTGKPGGELKKRSVAEGIPDVDHMHGPRGINLPVADTRDLLQKRFEFYGNYEKWERDVNRVNSELLDDNAEYTSMAGGKTISINGKDFAFWSNRNGNGSIDISIAKKHSGQGMGEGMMDNPGQEDSPVAQAIIRRILLQRTDLLAKHGPEKVGQAVDEVADFVGDVDEIGSSDVSGWIRHVEQMLGNMQEGDISQLEKDIADAPVAPIANMEEGEKVGNMDADAFDAAMARLKQLAGAGPMKTVYDPNKRVYRNVPTAVQPKK